nr:putative ribonuclease H-like domain-containing protein [Tanacetum cinerariifolium]
MTIHVLLIRKESNTRPLVRPRQSDNGIEFKNKELIEFCGFKWIKREYSNATTPHQNGDAERKNRTLIEAARTMLADYFLPTTFWAEAVNTACYVLNRVLVTKPQNKTPYELLTGKFDRKSDSGFLVGYSLNSKAFRVYSLENKRVEENLDIDFLENKPNIVGKGHAWMFDLDYLTNSMNYEPVLVDNQANKSVGPKEANNNTSTQANDDQGANSKEINLNEEYFVLPICTPLSTAGPSRAFNNGELSYPDPFKYALLDDPSMLEDIYANPSEGIFTDSSYDDEGMVTNFNNSETTISVSPTPITRIHTIHPKTQILGDPKNKKDERSVVARNKTRLVAQVHRQEERIDYDEVFAPVARIEAIRIFLAFASYMGFIVYQMDVKSVFLYGTIDKEVYVSQPLGFVDLKFPNKVYKVVKALYGLHQAPRAWFQMSSMGELTFFLGLQVKQKEDSIFISQDKYVAKILKKFDFLSVKTANTPIETQKPLVKDEKVVDVDVHLYRSIIGFLMYLTASRPDIMFAVCACSKFQVAPKTSHLHAIKRIFRYLKGQPKLGLWYPKVSSFDLEAYSDSDYAGANLDRKSTIGGCQFLGRRLISWQCKKQTIVATCSTEAEYVATAHCFFYSKTKHIEIRHHFIRDAYEKKLIQVLKILIDDNVADLLTKAFDVSSKELASPKQTALGKDISNPLMAGRLPKTKLPTRLEEENKVLKELYSVHSIVDTAAPVVEKEKSFKEGRIIADIDKDDVDDEEPAEVEEVLEVVTSAKLITEVVTTAGAILQLKQQRSVFQGEERIKQDEAFTRQLEAELNADINWNAVMEQVKRSKRLNDIVMKYQALKRKPLTEAQVRKKMIIYLKNMADYKMNCFKGMTYSEIRPLFEKHYNYNQAFLEEVNEEVTLPEKEVKEEGHKREEATPLASKFPIVDYKIHLERNKPYFKIIRAD